jgi:hypothetical protein
VIVKEKIMLVTLAVWNNKYRQNFGGEIRSVFSWFPDMEMATTI